MEREIALSSFPVRDVKGNRPGDFTTRFSPEIELKLSIRLSTKN